MSESLADPAARLDKGTFAADVLRHYSLTLGQDICHSSRDYLYRALALALRDRLVAGFKHTRSVHAALAHRQVFYISLEFLLGRALTNAVYALDLDEPLKGLLLDYGVALEDLAMAEHDAGLGNGGLGRLAACFLDSCATLGLPVTGYGLRYEYGMFQQTIENGQ